MKRVLMSVVLLLVMLPAAVSAQIPPPPPPPPPPTPVVPPLPPDLPRAPRAPVTVVAPMIDAVAIEEAVRAAARVDLQAAREAARGAAAEARMAVEQARAFAPVVAHEAVPFHFDWNHDFNFDFHWDQPFAFGREQDPSGSYQSGLNAITQKQWERAITYFDRAIAQKSPRADGALYWKAYAHYRNNQVSEAMATIAALRRDFGKSPYLKEAAVLEADVKRTPPDQIVDDEIKILAVSAQLHQEPERAVTTLEGVLNSTNSIAVKRRALYVLAQLSNPRARQILLNYAKGGGSPDLQISAIQYLGASKQKATAEELKQIYESATDDRIKMAVIGAFHTQGDRRSLMGVVSSSGSSTAIRSQALSGLTNILSPQDLWQLYEKEQDRQLRQQIVRAFGSMRAMDQLTQVLKVEKEPSVRQSAIRSLGNFKAEQTAATLTDMYGRETDVDTKKAIISALYAQNNAEALVTIARKENQLALTRDIVSKLAEMAGKSKAAADYLTEIINKR